MPASNRTEPPAKPSDKVEGLRERKKRATRLQISNVATKLFVARGFEHVTIDDVAAAAEVSKMTVFNYFARKEDLFFDRSDDVAQLLRSALDRRGGRSPVAALRALAHDLVEQGHPVTKVNRDVAGYWKVVEESTSLRARALELLEQLERELGEMLSASVEANADDPTARLIAALVLGGARCLARCIWRGLAPPTISSHRAQGLPRASRSRRCRRRRSGEAHSLRMTR